MLRSPTHHRCFDCFRPVGECYCATIPSIDNRTEIIILQHRRERFHPFNTARIVQRALRKSQLVIGHAREFAAQLDLPPGTGLLYPGDDAALLSDLPASEHPRQLVVLDGTWHHAKTFLRDSPALRQLPRYQLAPTSPSRYRIRREPTESSLSTLEATVAALKSLEPETAGLDQLLAAFDQMIDRQLAHPKSAARWQQHARRSPALGNIPHTLLGAPSNIVVVYGESSPGGQADCPLTPVYWVAERLGTSERFACAIQSPAHFSDAYLGYLELPAAHFHHAVSLSAAREAWQNFVRPGDLLTVYNQGTANLLRQLSSTAPHCLVLKSINLAWREPYPTLTQLLLGEKIPRGAVWADGRAGQRLAELVAYIHYLRSLSAASS